jgi:hypothetical protein
VHTYVIIKTEPTGTISDQDMETLRGLAFNQRYKKLVPDVVIPINQTTIQYNDKVTVLYSALQPKGLAERRSVDGGYSYLFKLFAGIDNEVVMDDGDIFDLYNIAQQIYNAQSGNKIAQTPTQNSQTAMSGLSVIQINLDLLEDEDYLKVQQMIMKYPHNNTPYRMTNEMGTATIAYIEFQPVNGIYIMNSADYNILKAIKDIYDSKYPHTATATLTMIIEKADLWQNSRIGRLIVIYSDLKLVERTIIDSQRDDYKFYIAGIKQISQNDYEVIYFIQNLIQWGRKYSDILNRISTNSVYRMTLSLLDPKTSDYWRVMNSLESLPTPRIP